MAYSFFFFFFLRSHSFRYAFVVGTFLYCSGVAFLIMSVLFGNEVTSSLILIPDLAILFCFSQAQQFSDRPMYEQDKAELSRVPRE